MSENGKASESIQIEGTMVSEVKPDKITIELLPKILDVIEGSI
ncbi:hypothetical protein ACFLYL_02375 [Chloroflexota bacterium]